VLAANVTAFLVAVGFYPLASLTVRFAQTPPAAGYGLGAPVVVAALMLTPFSLASFAASKFAARAARRTSAELVVALSCLALIASTALFAVARGSYPGLVAVMALSGLGVGAVYAVNPLQITGGVPAAETGSAISFYQLARTVGLRHRQRAQRDRAGGVRARRAPAPRRCGLHRRRAGLYRRPGRRAAGERPVRHDRPGPG